ncbi:unnamed protein product [Lactuca virosa]|uniref:Uncharacterized protein n=1 Tax=Lactuca virosa TaxID=75947 RepID=A0AAU9M623_9ASTR|nr:unnamed protein product [Lactuca virosa]
MALAGREHVEFSSLNSESSSQTESNLNQDMNHINSPSIDTDILQEQEQEQEQLGEVTNSCIHESTNKDPKKELEVLWRRVKTTASLLNYLKSKAKITMTNPHFALTTQSHDITNIDFSNFNSPWIDINTLQEEEEDEDGVYMNEVAKTVEMITQVMESLVERVIMAESETDIEKQKVAISQEEIIKKEIQVEIMSEKLDEMDRFAVDTNCVLNEMRQWVDNLVEETSRQKQRATQNEQELIRVKQDFESLKSYVNSLISVRETLVSSEKQFQTMEKLFERLIAKTTQLESEKKQKEGEVEKLMEENLRLNGVLDQKEAQLLAMNEQCKFMALSGSHI